MGLRPIGENEKLALSSPRRWGPIVGPQWIPAFAGATRRVIFIPLGGPKAHGNSL